MTTDTPSLRVPKLRFPQFRHMPGWGLTQLSNILDYEQPGNYIVKDTSYQDAGTPVLTANKSFLLGHTAEIDGIYQKVPVIIFDDFTTDSKYVDFPFKVKSSAIKILIPRTDDELRLVYELMSRLRFDATQHKRYFISQYQYLEIPLPGKSEQQKIVDCLSSLDDLIAGEVRKLDTLRQHKQGLMQQLFPQPGETVPRLRFPEFKGAGDWKLDQIGNIASITKGKRVSKADVTKGGATPCIRYAELYTHYGEVIDEVASRTNVPHENLILSQTEDVIVPASGETRVDIARAACVLSEGVALGSDLNVLRSDLYGPFFSYLLNSPVRHSIARVAQGDTVAHLYPTQLSQVWLAYPQRPEQRKIAYCLSAIDTWIGAQLGKIDGLRTHKQGLLQQLFPSLDGNEQ